MLAESTGHAQAPSSAEVAGGGEGEVQSEDEAPAAAEANQQPHVVAQIGIASFNILASAFVRFVVDHPEHLEPEARLRRLAAELRPLLFSRRVLCLQEVDEWALQRCLTALFHTHRYTYSATLVQPARRDVPKYGNLIAYPVDLYLEVRAGSASTMLAESIKVPPDFEPSEGARPTDSAKPRHLTVYQYAQTRSSSLLRTMLQDRATKALFAVYTCHLPCVHWWPAVGTLHVEALLRELRGRTWPTVPFVLTGDFNFVPKSALYQLLTTNSFFQPSACAPVWVPTSPQLPTGSVPRASHTPPRGDGDEGETKELVPPLPPPPSPSKPPQLEAPHTPRALRGPAENPHVPFPGWTVHAELAGQPRLLRDTTQLHRITTRSQRPFSPVFQGTLDYIFHSTHQTPSGTPRWSVQQTNQEDLSDETIILPNAVHSSDHVPITARLHLICPCPIQFQKRTVQWRSPLARRT